MDRIPALADLAPEPGNEPAEADEDWAAYDAAHAQWSDTWGDRLEFDHSPGNPDDDPGWPGAGYGPDGQWTAAEWLLLGRRMAADWRAAFDAMHQPKAA